jgi:hypothetical protein
MALRIGITIGGVVECDGDLLGADVNIAARLEGLAEVGGICVSRGAPRIKCAAACRGTLYRANSAKSRATFL